MTHCKIPVILHTDLGTDIDDTWALIMLLRQSWYDLKMVLVDTGDLHYRASLAASILTHFGRSDVTLGLGLESSVDRVRARPLASVLSGSELSSYPGEVYYDGTRQLIEVVQTADQPVALISIGPASALAAMLDQAPEIAQKIRFTGMFGSLKQSHEGKIGQIVEYNVRQDIPAAQRIFAAPWLESRFTPLDSCGQVILADAEYQMLANSSDPGIKLLFEHYNCWRRYHQLDLTQQRSSILFDTVAVHLACSTEFLQMKEMRLAVDDKGYLTHSRDAPLAQVATGWTDLPGYRKFLAQTICGHSPRGEIANARQ